MKNIFSAADIMLPDFINDKSKASKWAVVACDQYTSEPEYWDNVYKTVGKVPSTLNMILPEAFLLEHTEERLESISENMKEYSKSFLKTYKNSLVLVRRKVTGGKIRNGIVGKVDLEAYDYSANSVSSVRATEGTVLERIPPRVAVRRGASLELPHIMLLIDDPHKNIIEPVASSVSEDQKLYDFDLMYSDSVKGYLLTDEQKEVVLSGLEKLFENSKIALAVGDGNHSLASAKALYEEIKTEIGEEKALAHPARYALCEVVNLHDSSLEFEPIYRLVKTNNIEKLLVALEECGNNCANGTQSVKCFFGNKEKEISLGNGTHTLTVGTLQKFLDDYKHSNPDMEIDYIHGVASITRLAEAENCVGFVFDGMKKEDLFEAVGKDGALPRKTFSMGEAQDKRFYIECRKITE